jgi:hypothetical protein
LRANYVFDAQIDWKVENSDRPAWSGSGLWRRAIPQVVTQCGIHGGLVRKSVRYVIGQPDHPQALSVFRRVFSPHDVL